jgi:hypothetical protein
VSSTIRVSSDGAAGSADGSPSGDEGAQQLVAGTGVEARVLADVEGVQVEAEGLHLPQQRVDQQRGQAPAAVGGQGVAHQPQVRREVARVRVGVRMMGIVAREAQPRAHVAQEAAVELRLRAPLGDGVERGGGAGVALQRRRSAG